MPRILMYHHVAPLQGREGLTPYIVEPDTFRWQLDRIVASNLPVKTMAEFIDESAVGTGFDNCIIITFDDCSVELLEFAVPLLAERSLRASFYAVAGMLGGQNDWDRKRCPSKIGLMTASDLKYLIKQGHEVGAHGLRHVALDTLVEGDVVREVSDSKRILESCLDVTITTFAYPYGAIPANYARIMATAGYKSACSIFSESSSVLEDPYSLRRILIHNNDVGLRFSLKLSRAYSTMRRFRDYRSMRQHRKRSK